MSLFLCLRVYENNFHPDHDNTGVDYDIDTGT